MFTSKLHKLKEIEDMVAESVQVLVPFNNRKCCHPTQITRMGWNRKGLTTAHSYHGFLRIHTQGWHPRQGDSVKPEHI